MRLSLDLQDEADRYRVSLYGAGGEPSAETSDNKTFDNNYGSSNG